jgi:polyadenylate-binding protein
MQVEEWKKKNLYIKNLDKSIDESRLFDICKEYGPIKSLKICKMENIKYDSDGNCTKEAVSKEIAYVHFENEHHASVAMNELQKKLIEGKKLYVAKWKPRDAMKKIIGQFKTQKGMKFPIMPNRGFMPTRAVPIVPIMGKSNIMPYQQMPRARIPRAMNLPPPPQVHIPVVNEQKKPLVFRVDNIDQYSIRDLGENLYPIVLKLTNPQVVGKITGMLLEMDKIEVINLINDENILKARVGEAVEVLKKAWAQNKDALAVLSNLG